jgi:O-antigen ligase
MVLRAASVPSLSAAQLVGGRPLASFRWREEAWVVMPTTYFFNKRASLQAIDHSWPSGVGPGGQPAFTARLQREGRFPGTIWLTTPHSSYLGAVAELGAAGFAALLLILVAGGMTINRLLAHSARLHWEAAAYAGAGAAFLIEAISTDLFNCRHYWFLFAVMAAKHASIRSTRSSEPFDGIGTGRKRAAY